MVLLYGRFLAKTGSLETTPNHPNQDHELRIERLVVDAIYQFGLAESHFPLANHRHVCRHGERRSSAYNCLLAEHMSFVPSSTPEQFLVRSF